MALNVKTEVFEGPFDVLFHLIEKNRIDIYDIPIADLTEQYLEFIKDMDRDKLDSASEFLVMAATLLSIKSKMILPLQTQNKGIDAISADEAAESADPREDLVNRLVEYKQFKEISAALKSAEKEQKLVIKKSPEDLSPIFKDNFSMPDISLNELKSKFLLVAQKNKRGEEKITRISKDPLPVSRKISEIYRILKRVKSRIYFDASFYKNAAKTEIIVTFLAILELVRMNRILAIQNRQFDKVVVRYREDKTNEYR